MSENHGRQLITEPPVTIGADICKYIKDPLRLNYPCHSQTVDHGVQITSSEALLSTNYESRLGAAFTINNCRKEMPGRVCRELKVK